MKNHKQRWLMWWYQEQGISVILHVLLKYRHVFWNIKFWSTNDGVSFEFATLSINRNNKIIKTYEKCSTTNLMKQLCFSKWILISRIHFPIYFKYTITLTNCISCLAVKTILLLFPVKSTLNYGVHYWTFSTTKAMQPTNAAEMQFCKWQNCCFLFLPFFKMH